MFSATELAEIRSDFPILTRQGRGGNPIAYFDSAATSQKPACVIDAQAQFYRTSNGAVARGTHVLADEATQLFDDGRQRLARFIGGATEEVVFTKNATEGVNLLANGILFSTLENSQLKLGPDDSIVVTRAEHHANLLPWQRLARLTGAQLKWLDLLADGRIDLETLEVVDATTKIVAFTHASNVTGAVSPVSQIVAKAKKVGALVVLDTCQSSTHLPVNVGDLGVDAAVFSAHKMLGPTGIGALWARKELLELLEPQLLGGSMIAGASMTDMTYHNVPLKFEAGSQPVAQLGGWIAAMDYLDAIGMERIAENEVAITRLMLEGLTDIPGLRLLGPHDVADRLPVVSFQIEGVHPHDVGQVLDSYDIAVRTGHHCAIPLHRFFSVRSSSRASASLTTTTQEVERLVSAVKKVMEFFGV